MEREKGASVIDLLADYCVIDLETTGLDPSYDRIIEAAALRVRDGNVVAQFSQIADYKIFHHFTVYISVKW